MKHTPEIIMKKLFFLTITLLAFGITLAQNVSIGHTAPVAKLDIRGVIAVPSIPGFASTGILRVGVSLQEGIDIGKMGSPSYAGWIQSGIGGIFADPLSLQPLGGNVGIGYGATDPDATLHVNGTIKVADGTQGEGKILTSDATGLASWQPPPPRPGTNDPIVSICCQHWMARNLDVTTYRNGDLIPEVTDYGTWAALTTGAYCYYDNDSTNYATTFGKLYNWYAVNDPRGLAPEGWHIPTDFEWTTLNICLDPIYVYGGGYLKEIGTEHWASPNTGATNVTGFTALPAGYRAYDGGFSQIGSYGYWWSSIENITANPLGWYLSYNDYFLGSISSNTKSMGFSVRCLRD